MSKQAKDFQKATADRIAAIFAEGKQRRVLLSDEVGLGKTIIAKEVIQRVRDIRNSVNDDMYRVVYVCSNMNIVKQNTRNLGIKDVMDMGESRLTMQHLKLQEKVVKLKEEKHYREDGKYEHPEDMPVLLIPLTPGTSFSISNNYGNMNERALMYCLISLMPECLKYEHELNVFFQYKVSDDTWREMVRKYMVRVEHCGNDYQIKIHNALRTTDSFKDFLNALQKGCLDKTAYQFIPRLRMSFALISLNELEPDLVIMDEFQRFSSLLDEESADEQSMISKQFFGDLNKTDENINSPLILLLSATPYKPYSTLEELNELNTDEQYRDFYQLMDFMFKADKSVMPFKRIWEDYSSELSHLSSENIDILLAKKKVAEDKMYEAICRTERLNENLISTHYVKEIAISEGDVLSYCQMQKLLDDCREKAENIEGIRFNSYNIPMDYVKSCPYLLSFMDSYQLKKNITKVYELGRVEGFKLPISTIRQRYLLKTDHIYHYKKIPSNNARLEYVKNILFDQHAERMLWIPTSHPYYTTPASNVFEINKDFSKILIFSAWEMVPRMLSVMLSYEAERRTIGEAFENEKASYTNKTGHNRLNTSKESLTGKESRSKEIITYPCSFLAGLYSPKEFYGKPISSIQSELKQRISTYVSSKVDFTEAGYSSADVYNYLLWLDGDENVTINVFSRKALDVLVNLAIGGPAECLLRILKEKEKAKKLAENFVTLFNRRQSAAIIDLIYEHKDLDVYYEQVVDYCVMGNLQAVLDEFVHMIDESGEKTDEIYQVIDESFIEMESGLSLDTTDTFAKGNLAYKRKKKHMRTHIALPFMNAKIDESKIKVANKTREAFNSPFRPFVLASTSVGQEGLDFHWYCRKIVHWNTPSNPQDLEQREGRINRYKCLAIRRNIAKLYKSIYDWNEMFSKAATVMKDKYHYADLVPYWCLPPELIKEMGDEVEMIERIVPMYPMSIDKERYDRLIAVLSLYRLTLGQPRQEELLDMLKDVLSPMEIKKLLFDLSPINRIRR